MGIRMANAEWHVRRGLGSACGRCKNGRGSSLGPSDVTVSAGGPWASHREPGGSVYLQASRRLDLLTVPLGDNYPSGS